MAAVAARWDPGAEAFLRAIEPLARIAVALAGVQPGERILDAAAGDGDVALHALGLGAAVSACDRSAGMVARGRDRCAQARWEVADVDALPYADAEFDAVVGGLGVAFSSRPRRAARELLCVLRPGGVLVLALFTPHSFTGRVLKMAEGRRPPTAGVPPPSRWGHRDVARRRLEAAGDVEVDQHDRVLPIGFASVEAAWTAFSDPFGLPEASRDRFADALLAQSASAPGVELRERLLLVRARRLY